jgi:hypothetical protein
LYCWMLFSSSPELLFLFYLFPCFYYLIISIPASMLYDFGIYFLAYLRGTGGSSIVFFELIYDYIAVIVFFSRILVQGVRLFLVLIVYASMHDLILFFIIDQHMFFSSTQPDLGLYSTLYPSQKFSYFLLVTLPGYSLQLIYEILHTCFFVLSQISVFFIIVFWLFLFLYTFFVFEKIENYFYIKRKERGVL